MAGLILLLRGAVFGTGVNFKSQTQDPSVLLVRW
jgi:hypothetical protein